MKPKRDVASPSAPVRPPAASSRDPVVIRTKLSVPRIREHLVPRTRLTSALEQLMLSPTARVGLLAAPAGFGKTTLIAQWLRENPRPHCWVAFDSWDDDEVVFWMYLIEALRELHPAVGSGSLWELRTPRPAIRERVVPLVLHELEAVDADSVVVLDDLQFITSPACMESLSQFLVRLPPKVRVVLATRREPELPLSRFRARGHLVELPAEELRFTRAESAAMLQDPASPPLQSSEVDLLHDRTEGWPAGLYLAALSLRGPRTVAEAVANFTAANRHIGDYLGAEVMNDLDPRAREFLVLTSVLERVTGALGDAVTDGSDGDELLDGLWRSNRFVLALDDDRQWYRYHQLFREFLQAELHRQAPRAAATAHLRASAWLEDAGLIAPAIAHALEGDDLHRAATLLDAHRVELLDAGLARAVLGWMARMPDDVVAGTPRLARLALSALRLVDAPASAYERWEVLLHASPAIDPAGPGEPRTSAGLLRAAELTDDVGASARAAKESSECDAEESVWWLSSQALLARALYFDSAARSGAAAEHAASAVLDSDAAPVPPSTKWIAYSVLALLRLDGGDVAGAASLASSAWSEAVDRRRYGSPGTGIVHVALGRCRAYEGDFAAAQAEFQFALSLDGSRSATVGHVHILVAIAEAYSLSGDRSAALAAAGEARELIAALRDPGRLPSLLAAALRQREGLAGAPPVAAPRAAEGRVLRLLASSLSQRDIGRELYLSQNTVKSHTRSLYRKLGVVTRAEAVAAARARGWLR